MRKYRNKKKSFTTHNIHINIYSLQKKIDIKWIKMLTEFHVLVKIFQDLSLLIALKSACHNMIIEIFSRKTSTRIHNSNLKFTLNFEEMLSEI